MKIWIDDQVDDPETPERHANEGFMPANSVEAAKSLVEKYGPPEFLELDHDLGIANGSPTTVMEFLKWLAERYPDSVPGYAVHSRNPAGVENIHSFMRSWKKSMKLDE